MKKKIVLLLFLTNFIFGSDPITIDSLFKKQLGIRSITTLEYLSSGNADFYRTYPYINAYNNGKNYTDNRQLSFRQLFIYSLNENLDITFGGRFSFVSSDYVANDFSRQTANHWEFNSLSAGFIYATESFKGFIPQISFDIGALDRMTILNQRKNFYAKSASLQFALKNYSDPLISSFYIGGAYNQDLKFDAGKINFGNAVFAGFNGSIILSPKISLDLSFQQTYQEASTHNGEKYTQNYSIPTMSLGFTYSLDDNTAFSISGTGSGSSSAPSSIFSLSLWKKF